MKVLFYIEPVVFRNFPRQLEYWFRTCSAIAQANRDFFTSYIAASRTLCDLEGGAFDASFPVDNVQILKASGFDRSLYAKDLYDPTGSQNAFLLRALDEIDNTLHPDIVVSWTENRHLRAVFGPERLFFMELGPIPRAGFKWSAYLDPYGHQVGCAFSRACTMRSDPSLFAGMKEVWEQTWQAEVAHKAAEHALAPWLMSQAAGRKTLLLVLQPPDWPTYNGAGIDIDSVALVRKVADQMPQGWAVLPQWKDAHALPPEVILHDLAEGQGNILLPEPPFRHGFSEAFLPLVDHVSTISSNVAATAAIIGKPLQILGKSKFSLMNVAVGETAKPRFDLLSFLVNGYCRPIDEWTALDGALSLIHI